MKHVYLFYKKPIDGFFQENILYAFTDSKELCEDFKKQRNMKKFILYKRKVTKQEFFEIRKKFNKHELQYCQFHTKSKSYGEYKNVKVLCTYNEEETVVLKSDKIWDDNKKFLFDAKIFTSEYIRALEKLCFITFYVYKNGLDDYSDYFYSPFYNLYGPPSELIRELENIPYRYDELGLFLKFFKDTF